MITLRNTTLALLLLSTMAHAQAPSRDEDECESRDPTTAEVNSREGVRLAKEGQFRAAIALFRIAVNLDQCAPDHRLLLARGLSRLEDFGEAEVIYKEVMGLFPGSPEAERARRELDELKHRPPKKDPNEGAASQPTKLEAPPPGPPWREIGLGTAGLGVILFAAGAYFALDAQAADDDLQAAARGTDRARYDSLVDDRSGSTTLSYVSYGLGVALIGGGVAMATLLHQAPPPVGGEVKGVSMAPAAQGLGFSLIGRF
ncbi:hypothetical protein KKB55_08280 [Myxococcota bacterium]|nr:hypothetical protein [Myxococcota bacterium]MBU1897742.1 hypothetical protein [Myxococcota bacterium]